MGGDDRGGGTGGGGVARSILGAVMISESSGGPDLINADAWSGGSMAGSCCAPMVAVGGPVVIRYGP